MNAAPVPTRGNYRGIPLHDFQPPARLRLVRKSIDAVHRLDDLGKLFDYAANILNAPEARLFAAAKIRAAHAQATEERRVRPNVDLDRVAAVTAGLNTRRCMDAMAYRSIFDVPTPPGQPDAVMREIPLTAPQLGRFN